MDAIVAIWEVTLVSPSSTAPISSATTAYRSALDCGRTISLKASSMGGALDRGGRWTNLGRPAHLPARAVRESCMRLAGMAAAVALAAAGQAWAQVAEGPSRTFTGRDLFGLQQASDPQVRPDGGAIAYVRARYDIMT